MHVSVVKLTILSVKTRAPKIKFSCAALLGLTTIGIFILTSHNIKAGENEECIFTDGYPGNIFLAKCETARFAKLDKTLNVKFRIKYHLLDRNKDKQRELLLSERRWIDTKDKSCKEEADEMIGRSRDIAALECQSEMTSARIKELDAIGLSQISK